VLFDDGSDGWLADASGQYMPGVTAGQSAAQLNGVALPRHDQLTPGTPCTSTSIATWPAMCAARAAPVARANCRSRSARAGPRRWRTSATRAVS
ncbi:hypothetical protein ACU4GD_29520, partial [Cupriavidus basilensis]